MERLLLDNLAANQAFNELMRRGTPIDKLVGQFAEEILFNDNEAARGKAIGELSGKIAEHYARDLQSSARSQGVENARGILEKLATQGYIPDIEDARTRRAILYDLNLKDSARVKIVQRLIDDKANTLENRLAAYYLEPGGLTPRQKIAQLREIHKGLEEARKKYESGLLAHTTKGEPKPRKPKLDYLSKFAEDCKDEVRVQSRRAGTDAETATFRTAGVVKFAWITVNRSEACPDCKVRQGYIGPMEYFQRIGLPGSGATVCGATCFCMLVPEETLAKNPNLKNAGLEQPKEPINPTPANTTPPPDRVTPPPAPAAPPKPKAAPAPPAPPPAPPPPPVWQDRSRPIGERLTAWGEGAQVRKDLLTAAKDPKSYYFSTEPARVAAIEKTTAARKEWDRLEKLYRAADRTGDSATKQTLRPQLQATADKWKAASEEIQKLNGQANAKIHDRLALPAAERGTWRGVNARTGKPLIPGNATKEPIDKAEAFLDKVIRRPAAAPNIPGVPTRTVNYSIGSSRTRASHTRGDISLAHAESPRTVVHEWGHELEDILPNATAKAQEFLRYRVKGETPQSMRKLFGGFKANEYGRGDDWIKTFGRRNGFYVGKDYAHGSTEVVSMGLEMMYADPVHFATMDPEYFDFILFIVRGHA